MFNQKMKFFFMAAVISLAGVTAANAQFSFGSKLSVTIPTDFVVGDKAFPAGNYTIAPTPNTADSPSILVLRGENESMVFDTMKGDSGVAAKDTQLIFRDVDGVSFLSKILFKGETTRIEIPTAKYEKRLIASVKKDEPAEVGTGSSY
jgi:hypothetical protein